MTDLFSLPLVVERYEIEPLSAEGTERRTLLVRMWGGDVKGVGEDVSPFGMEGFPESPPPPLELAGEWTLGSFCAHVSGLKKWEIEPEWDGMIRFRNWAFESAALDLALQQAGRSLADVLGREPRPLRFVNSLGLGDPPTFEALSKRLEAYPSLRFKLDADARWTPELCDAVVDTGAVDIVDFKGRYNLPVEDEDQLVAMYECVLARFPDALFEDPHDLPRVAALMEPVADRISYDAPIHEAADITTRTINVKPSRIGSLAALFGIYEHCERHGIAMYSGGMGELAVGRTQTQLLSALFHPDAPNDIAPAAYNLDPPPPGLPESPLETGSPVGFR